MDPNRPTDKPAILNSVRDNKSLSRNLEISSSAVTAVSDYGPNVSCIIQRLLKRLPVNFQNQLQPADCRLLAANQAETAVSGLITLPISVAGN